MGNDPHPSQVPGAGPAPQFRVEPERVGELVFSNEVNELLPALLKARKNISPAQRRAYNPERMNQYADNNDVIEAVDQPLLEEKIMVIQGTRRTARGAVIVTTRLMHESGQFVETSIELVPERFDPQSQVSAITYGRKTTLALLTNLRTSDDDDGRKAAARPVASVDGAPAGMRVVEATGQQTGDERRSAPSKAERKAGTPPPALVADGASSAGKMATGALEGDRGQPAEAKAAGGEAGAGTEGAAPPATGDDGPDRSPEGSEQGAGKADGRRKPGRKPTVKNDTTPRKDDARVTGADALKALSNHGDWPMLERAVSQSVEAFFNSAGRSRERFVAWVESPEIERFMSRGFRRLVIDLAQRFGPPTDAESA